MSAFISILSLIGPWDSDLEHALLSVQLMIDSFNIIYSYCFYCIWISYQILLNIILNFFVWLYYTLSSLNCGFDSLMHFSCKIQCSNWILKCSQCSNHCTLYCLIWLVFIIKTIILKLKVYFLYFKDIKM